jgi:ComF family protein
LLLRRQAVSEPCATTVNRAPIEEFTAVLDLLFAEQCAGCGGTSSGGLCRVCVADLPRTRNPCARCGLARPVAQCPRHAAAWRVEGVVAAFAYAPPLDHYIHALKYGGARALGRAFGLLLAADARRELEAIDALVPVPLHPARLRERGYNQAIEIARPIARRLGVPLLLRGIARPQPGVSQTAQGAAARRASVTTAFAVSRSLAGLRIAIVDDVVTTGATVNALAAALYAAGAASCIAIAAARTPEAGQARNV